MLKHCFSKHLEVFKATYGISRIMNGLQVPPLLNPQHLDLQNNLFKVTMKNNANVALKELCDINPITKLRQNITSSYLLTFKILVYIKAAQVVAQVIDSFEDKQCFFTLCFTKNKICNRLTNHQNLELHKFA
jgi:hypothetical protein